MLQRFVSAKALIKRQRTDRVPQLLDCFSSRLPHTLAIEPIGHPPPGVMLATLEKVRHDAVWMVDTNTMCHHPALVRAKSQVHAQ